MNKALQSNSDMPLYRQLINLIRTKIQDGTWKTGDQIPSEAELKDLYSISRITIRNAIAELVEEGLLAKRQGKGTYVLGKRLERDLHAFSSFTQVCINRGSVPSTITLSVRLKTGSAKICRSLDLPENSKVLAIERIRLVDNEPAILETNYFSPQFSYLLQEDLNTSLYDLLKKHGVYPTSANKTIEICYATETEAQHLQVAPDTALLLVVDQVFDQDLKILHLCKQIIRSDRFKFSV